MVNESLKSIKDIYKPERDSAFYLKPCPFCGSNEVAYYEYEHTAGKRFGVMCCGCMAEIEPGYAQDKATVRDMWNKRTNEDRMCADLSDGFKLVAEKNHDPNFCREVFIGILNKEGVWCQDLAIVRNSYTYDENGDTIWKDNIFDVLVYADKDNEDYTNDFQIGLHNE